MPEPALNRLFEANKRPTANEENVGGIHPDVLLLRMLSAPLRRNVAYSAFQDLQQRLLNAFAGHIASDRNVFSFSGDLVDLIDVNDAHLRPLDIVVRVLKQA